MANKNIDDLPTATSWNAGDKLEILQGGTNKQIDASLLGAVQSVTGTNVDNTDPLNPIVNTQTLQQVVTESPLINDPITSLDGQTSLSISNLNLGLSSDGVIDLSAPIVTKNGVEIATVNDLPTIDTTIIDGSTNPVDGNAVFDALALKQDISSEQLASLTSTSISTTSSGNTDLTEMNTTVLANTTYTIDGIIRIGCNNTGGVALQLTLPSGSVFLALNGPTTSSTVGQWLNIPSSATLTGSYCRINTSAGFVYIKGTVEVGATGGNLVWGFASVVNPQTSTVYRLGTQIKITKK